MTRRPQRRAPAKSPAMTQEQFAAWKAAVSRPALAPPPEGETRPYRLTCEPCGRSTVADLTRAQFDARARLTCSACKCRRTSLERA